MYTLYSLFYIFGGHSVLLEHYVCLSKYKEVTSCLCPWQEGVAAVQMELCPPSISALDWDNWPTPNPQAAPTIHNIGTHWKL
jgi:hypothetical protein